MADRTQALRDVGEAIAFAPQRRDALPLLRSLLDSPPPQGAAIVATEIRSAAFARMSRTRFLVAGLILTFGVVATPIVVASAGVRSVTSLAAIIGSFAWAAVALVVFARKKLGWRAIGIVALFGASASMSLADGPLLASPALAILFAMGRLLTGMRDERRIIVALAAAAIAVPAVLGLAGILVAYRFEPDGIVLQGALGAPPGATFLRLTFLHLTCVLGCAAVAWQCRRHLDEVEEQTLLTTWQLSRLITDRERSSA